MKALKLPLTLLLATTACSMAAVVNFDGMTFEQPLTAAPGWTTSHPNPSGAPLAWAELVGGNMAGAVGGAYAEAPSSTFSATYDSSYYGATIDFSLDLLLVSSTATAPGRDTFSIAMLAGSGSSLMTLVFSPAVDFGDGVDRWEVGYSVAGGDTVYTGFTIREEVSYDISVVLTGSAFNFTYSNSLDSRTFTGSVAGYNSATDGMGDVSFVWTKSPTEPFGDNYMTFDNLTVVPEPSVALLGGLASLFMLRRRR